MVFYHLDAFLLEAWMMAGFPLFLPIAIIAITSELSEYREKVIFKIVENNNNSNPRNVFLDFSTNYVYNLFIHILL